MIIYPAIDISHKKCVRLTQGKASQVTVYSEDPVQIAMAWESKGAQALHVVDLDRAIVGTSDNTEVIRKILSSVKIPVQVGGGLRSLGAIEKMVSIGCARVILGTKAYENKIFLAQALERFRDKVAVAVDTKDGKVAVLGWTVETDKKTTDFLQELEQAGVKTVIYTDIARDGMMLGPDIPALEAILQATKMTVIYSGGIGKNEDVLSLKKLEKKGLAGVIIGKALYEGTVQLEEVM